MKQESIDAMKSHFYRLPNDGNFRDNELGAWEYAEQCEEEVSGIALGIRASELCKALKYRVNERRKPDNSNSDWPSGTYLVYPRKILDTAYWHITIGQHIQKAQAKANKPPKQAKVVKCCDCGKEYETADSWRVRCLDCYKKQKSK